MRFVLLAFSAALLLASSASGSSVPLRAPGNLHAFEYVTDEGVKADHTYAQMPAFAWSPATGAASYQIQLATSRRFTDATLLYDKTSLAPVASIQLQVPWMTGNPYAFWVRVRAVGKTSTSPWSEPFGFNTQWQSVPTRSASDDGLVHWTPVDGATAYEVLYLGVPGGFNVHFTTLTNVADEREWWSFHAGMAGTVQWRVRAVRNVATDKLPNGVAVAKYGPYSPVYSTSTAASFGSGALTGESATSNVTSTPTKPHPHQLTPGFTWTGGNLGSSSLWRVYVFSDKQCVNPVMVGSVVGSPAWAPRASDPLALPGTVKDLKDAKAGKYLGFGSQAGGLSGDGTVLTPAESGSGSGSTSASSAASISLPDNGWPEGRYWWTVVPVIPVSFAADPTKGVQDGDKVEYHDSELPQDACAAGDVYPFGMQSAPVTTSSQLPYVSGLQAGRLTSAAREGARFSELPLITWKAALGAQSYEIELSHKSYPWKTVRSQTSVVTSSVLDLKRTDIGTWFYRVRGVNPYLVGAAQKMTWSNPVKVTITGDEFTVVK